MQKFLRAILVILLASVPAAAQTPSVVPVPPSVVPVPWRTSMLPGSFTVRSGAVIAYQAQDAAAKFDAEYLASLVQRTRGIRLVPRAAASATASRAAIVIARPSAVTASWARESYELTVSAAQVNITAGDDGGLFYGAVTLWQLLTADEAMNTPAVLHCMKIDDVPQLRWRGIMLDSARHMQPVSFIYQLIDWMALEKLNTLHWHLTDDQGWRLEIKRYPKLTQIGAYRELYSPTGKLEPSQGITEQSLHYGGYYTQQQVRELVAYAEKRNVTIVPEIEMPGHETAAIASYPQLASTQTPPTAPTSRYGILPNLFNVDDSTFTFLENVLTEVMQLFPSEYIHVGGDEAFKAQWQASPEIQAKMKALGIRNEDGLQSYFIQRMDAFITAHHRRTVGWDEILQGGLAPGAAVMSWHGVQGGIDAAKLGHDAVLTPARPLYFNYRQSDGAHEAPGRWALNTLADVYNFNPAPATLTAEQRAHIIGVQGNLWSEYVISPDRVQWMVFPRAAALGEIGWSTSANRNWNDFLARMVAENHRFKMLGIHYDPAIFSVRSAETVLPGDTQVQVALSTQSGYGAVHYTTDSTSVTAASPLYSQPLTLPLNTQLRAADFGPANGEKIDGSELHRSLDLQTLRLRYSPELQLCSNSPVIGMEQDPPRDGRPVSLANYQKPCWIYKGADLGGIRSISAGVMSLPYLFSERNPAPPFGPAHTQYGEIEVHLDACTGPVLTLLPVAPAVGHLGVTTLTAAIPPQTGTHDLCLKVVRPTANPLWVINWATIGPPPAKP